MSERIGSKWHRVYPACLDCGSTEKPHAARGLCSNCANRVGKPGYDGNAAPSQGKGGARLSEAERDELAARAVARARERGWRPLGERAGEMEGEMIKGWAGNYHACRDCGSDKRPHVADGLCTLCHMERSGHTPTALEAAILDGAEPPLARASGTNLPPDAPAPPARILPSRGEPDRRDDGAAKRLHDEALARARARHGATFGPDAAPPRDLVAEHVVPLPEPEPIAPAERGAPFAPSTSEAAGEARPAPSAATIHLVREEIEQGEAMASAPAPAPISVAIESIPTDQLVAELRRRQEAARRAYEDALAAMESLDGALGALAAPAPARQLRGVA